MGEIKRHGEIYKYYQEKIRDIRGDEDYAFMELGNFLTDISQFRDPYAHLSAKKTIFNQARAAFRENPYVIGTNIVLAGVALIPSIIDFIDKKNKSGAAKSALAVSSLLITEYILFPIAAIGFGKATQWMDVLMGKATPKNRRYGKLAQFFEQLCLGITHIIFADDIPKRARIDTMLPGMFSGINIASAEIDRVFKGGGHNDESRSYTQYYPHEHVDFPPYTESGIARQRKRRYQKGRRGLIIYLEEQLKYIVEELILIEYDWKKFKRTSSQNRNRHDVLARMGHILHAVEDYFFHSNYVELRLWNELKATRSSMSVESFENWFAEHALDNYRNYKVDNPPDSEGGYSKAYDFSSPHNYSEDAEENRRIREIVGGKTRWLRKLYRRLRYPLFKSKSDQSTDDSKPAYDLIYTGGFGEKDMFHTMIGAIGNLEFVVEDIDKYIKRANTPGNPENIAQDELPFNTPISESELVLMQALFNETYRREMVEDADILAARQREHRVQLEEGKYEDGITKLKERGYLNDQAEEAFRKAFEIDLKMDKQFQSSLSDAVGGVGRFLLQFLTMAQKDFDISIKRSVELDRRGKREILNKASDNGASGETVGNHSVLAKDTPKSQPLFEEARALATMASTIVATIMTTEIQNGGANRGIRWSSIIRHLLRFPHINPNMWEREVLETFRSTGKIPDYEDINDKPQIGFITNNLQAIIDRMRNRNAEEREREKEKLEKLYIKLEKDVDPAPWGDNVLNPLNS